MECESCDIIANSCNYITVDEMFMPKLAALLNSALLNWRFKLTSTNNHVNNYELDELPLIDISDIGDDVLASEGADRDRNICRLYGLDETEYIISRYYDIA